MSPDLTVQIRNSLKQRVSSPRYDHIMGVERAMDHLCGRYELDALQMKTCVLLHDYCREDSVKPWIEKLAKANLLDEITEQNPVLVHAKAAYLLGQEKYSLEKSWVEPVAWHTTGRLEMTLEDMALFVCDAFEPSREWSSWEIFLEKSENLLESVRESLVSKLEFTIRRGKMIHPHSIEAWNWVCSELSKRECAK